MDKMRQDSSEQVWLIEMKNYIVRTCSCILFCSSHNKSLDLRLGVNRQLAKGVNCSGCDQATVSTNRNSEYVSHSLTQHLSSLVVIFCLKHRKPVYYFCWIIYFAFCFFFLRYNDFHSLQMQTSGSYPELVNEELKKYDGEVCKYFQVDRRQTVVSKNNTLRQNWRLVLSIITTLTNANLQPS